VLHDMWFCGRPDGIALTGLRRLSEALTHACPIRVIEMRIAIYDDQV
jgi:hypothetical protein